MASIQQLKLLINLAKADGDVKPKERQYIINIGQANHLLVAEILPLFSSLHPEVVPAQLSDEEKFESIFLLVQLMKIDDKIYQNEIKYVAHIASLLGYKEDVLIDLMTTVKNSPMGVDEVSELKKLTATHLVGS